jgi:ribonucleoside-triphosphate reductase (thioredoxin)
LSSEWSNLAGVVYRRTYARKDNGVLENWGQTVERAIRGNVKGKNVPESEVQDLLNLARERKAGPAGRGYWFSGTAAHEKIGGVALNNCWFLTAENWEHFIIAQDLLMLGGGVGFSVEQQFASKLPKIKKDVQIVHKATKDADFIVPDSREGWCELTRRVLESFFVTGKSFSYSTVCVRGYGELIVGFGGTASGPQPLIQFINTLCSILIPRGGKHARTVDAADILTATGELVVSGNVRRSAILILGDCWDKDYLKAKRWDLVDLPSHRSCANYSVVCDDIEDLHPLFWKTYEQGEPFGILNRTSMQKFGRMGELKADTAIGANPCVEACLENGEPCNLTEMALPNMDNEEEFIKAAQLMQRYAKRVTMEHYHHKISDEVIKRNRRTGNGITGCLASPLFNSATLDRAYEAIQVEDREYSKELGIPTSKRTTVVKPSGTMSKVLDCMGYEGIHAAYSRYIIQRVRFASNDLLIPKLRAAGHHIEPLQKFDGSIDPKTLVVDFYVSAPDGSPVADEDWDTWKQLDVLKMAQKHWSDQAVSVTVYYKREDIPQLKTWLAENLQYLKSISFLCHGGHDFKQAPKEAISREQFEKMSTKIKPLNIDEITEGDMIAGLECEGGTCPVR